MLLLFARQICFSTSLTPNTGAHRSCWSSNQPPRHFLARITFCGTSRPASTACAVLSSLYINASFSLCLAGVGKVRALVHLKGHCLPLRRSLCRAVVSAPAQPAPAAIMAPTDTGMACAAAEYKHIAESFPSANNQRCQAANSVCRASQAPYSTCQLSRLLSGLLPCAVAYVALPALLSPAASLCEQGCCVDTCRALQISRSADSRRTLEAGSKY